MTPTVHALFIVCSLMIAALGIVMIVTVIPDFSGQFTMRKKLAKLRASGRMPEKDKTSDADVIRLANENMRDEAALLYAEIHGCALAPARETVGSRRHERLLLLALLIFFLNMCLSLLYKPGDLLIIAWVVGSIAFLISWHDEKKKVRNNRELIASGQLPETIRTRK